MVFQDSIFKTLKKGACSSFEQISLLPQQLRVNALSVIGAKSLDFVLGDSTQKCKSVNKLMLILCLQLATILKTRLPQRHFLQNLRIFSVYNFIKS